MTRMTRMRSQGSRVQTITSSSFKLEKNDYNLPSHNAVAQILRDYLGLDTEATPKELENYRSAMSRMAADIITLRTQVLTLETENSQLRTNLPAHPDLGRHLLDDADIAVMTKAEIADHMASLKFKLATQTNEASLHRDRIQQLQNELIKKNDSEKELLQLRKLLQSGHHVQQQQQQRKGGQENVATIAALEATVRRQGKVIETMEKAVIIKKGEKKSQRENKSLVHRTQPGTGRSDSWTRETELAMEAENSRLREELDESLKQKTNPPRQESLSLLSKLERAEVRIHSLEAQMVENCKVWGQKTQALLSKLDEYKRGLVQTEDTVFPHNSSES